MTMKRPLYGCEPARVLDRLVMERADEQMANFRDPVKGMGPRACMPCGEAGCVRKIAKYNRTGLCTVHARKRGIYGDNRECRRGRR